MTEDVADHVARAMAQKALDKIESHEDLCATRYENITEKLGALMKVIGWGGSLVASVLIGLVGYLSVKLIDANSNEAATLRAKVEILEADRHRDTAGAIGR